MNKVQKHRLHLVRWLNYHKESRKHTLIIAWVSLRPHGKENQSCSSSLSYASPCTIDHLKAGDCLIILKPWFPQSPSNLTRTWLPTWEDTAFYCLSTLSSRGNRRALPPHLLTHKVLTKAFGHLQTWSHVSGSIQTQCEKNTLTKDNSNKPG